MGWGAHMGDLSASSINVLELRAVMLAMKSFCQILLNFNILLSTYNTTVRAYLNNKGGSHIFQLWEVSHLDLFAMGLNNQLLVFISPFQDPQA